VKTQTVIPEYVEQLPKQMREGVLYICEEFDLTAHKCCCGCGEDVFNKLSPARWRLIKQADGSVSLDPSIGNWKYACRSHYYIRNSRVIDAGPMRPSEIEAVQRADRRDRDRHIARLNRRPKAVVERSRRLVARMLERLRALLPW
jgi:hypothetical protein